ncbi:unnamed protein product [Clonostachys rosea f. rosea IK726]|uniref:SWR1-complex protein 5 n=2 Tax=Bionectria ochroleuca TaxID=29856 RepID=A0A0B7JS03_BIOOC|nr:unnamed protein product [Clonostachys rosea f. rosea IK726]
MPEPIVDDDEQYDSSADSDFAPENVQGADSEASGSEDNGDDGKAAKARKDGESPRKKQRVANDGDAEDAGYDNSGDEAIIKKGEKKRAKAKSKAKTSNEDDDEGGEGGLIKTRHQRAAEKEERRMATNNGPVTIDVDAVWQQMLAGKPASKPAEKVDQSEQGADSNTSTEKATASAAASDDPSELVRIKRTYNFAGQVHTEEKMVHRDSAEAKLYFASEGQEVPANAPPAKRVAKKAFRSAFEPITDPLPQRADLNLGMAARMQAGKDAQAKKLNTVEKSRMDWAGYVDKQGIKDELELAGKSKHSYTAREDFLARSEARREDDARRARLTGRA